MYFENKGLTPLDISTASGSGGCPPIFTFAGMKQKTAYEVQTDVDVLLDVEDPWHLVVWNDEVNTFEWVIETLVQVCGHSQEQAEQCAYIIHFRGKYAVKHGSFDELKPMRDAITERGIGATVEETAGK